MASSTQEQSFVAKEVHPVKKNNFAEAAPPPLQNMEVDIPQTSVQPSTVPIIAPAAPAVPQVEMNVQSAAVAANSTVSAPSPAPAQAAIPVPIATQSAPTPAAVTEAPAAVKEAPAAVTEAPAAVTNGVHSTENPTTKVEEAAPPGNDSVATAPNPELEKLILQEQFKFCTNLVKQMKKRKEGFLFSNPVDPVVLNIPTYFDVIESPMDLSTIEKKISSNSYKAPNQVKNDVTLMFNNCYKFNGMEAQVSNMGMDLQKYFEKEWEKLPKEVRIL